MMRRLVLTGVAFLGFSTVGLATAAAGPDREVALKNRGAGVCVSQVAILPELVGADRLGQFARGGSLRAELAELRNACGSPPGPGHLGG